MSNGINHRQNEDKSIYMLAASSQIYQEAKRMCCVFAFFEVWLPFLLAVMQIFVRDNDLLSEAVCLVSIAGLFIGKLFQDSINKKKQHAAAIQQEFDTYTYQMPWNSRVFGEKVNLNELIADKSQKFFGHESDKERLKNWYQILADELPLEKGILLCQRENICWDAGLRKRYRNLCIVIFSIMVFLILGAGIVQNERTLEFLRRISFVAPLLYWVYECSSELNSDIERLERIRNKVIRDDEKTMPKLQEIQKDIWEHRAKCYLIPEYLHSIYKNKDEEVFQVAARLEINRLEDHR